VVIVTGCSGARRLVPWSRCVWSSIGPAAAEAGAAAGQLVFRCCGDTVVGVRSRTMTPAAAANGVDR